MKYLAICALFTFVLFAQCGSDKSAQESNDMERADSDDTYSTNNETPTNPQMNTSPVSLSISPNSFQANNMEKAEITVQNNTNNQVDYGERYWVEQNVNGTWQKSGKLSELAFNDILIELKAGQSQRADVFLTPPNVSYEPGSYRLCKEFTVNGRAETVCADFTVQ